MPIYEYRCESCDHEFERFQQRNDDDPEACPDCGEGGVKRLISDTSFQLKGSGWYETDYARDDDPGGTEPDASTEPEGDGASDEADDSASETADADETEAVAGDPEPA
jgi:putative FmdB family regulatory protein